MRKGPTYGLEGICILCISNGGKGESRPFWLTEPTRLRDIDPEDMSNVDQPLDARKWGKGPLGRGSRCRCGPRRLSCGLCGMRGAERGRGRLDGVEI